MTQTKTVTKKLDRVLDVLKWLGFVLLVVWVVRTLMLSDPRRYAEQFHISKEQVVVLRRPDDCDFLHAPIGQKGCHYLKILEPQRDEKGRIAVVFVAWKKVND